MAKALVTPSSLESEPRKVWSAKTEAFKSKYSLNR